MHREINDLPQMTQLVSSQTEIHTPVASQMLTNRFRASLLFPHLSESYLGFDANFKYHLSSTI